VQSNTICRYIFAKWYSPNRWGIIHPQAGNKNSPLAKCQ
jgi:hypothetical protein